MEKVKTFIRKFTVSPIISHVRVLLPITLKHSQKLLVQLEQVDPKSTALLISINGFLQQPQVSSLLHDSIRTISQRKKVPVHTFLEDNINGLSYYVATAGKNIYANPFCKIGDLVVPVKSYLNIHKLLNYFGIKYQRLGINQTSLWNPSLQPSQKQKQFSKKWLSSIQQKLKASIPQKRSLHPSALQQFGNKLIHPKKALQLRLVDKLTTFEQFIQQHFPNNKLDLSQFSNRPTKIRFSSQQINALAQLTQWMEYPRTALMAMQDPLNQCINNFVQILTMRMEDPEKLQELDLIAGKLMSYFETQIESRNNLII